MQNYYECNSCNYKSTRKTNANRHIKLVHKGNAHAFNFKTGQASSTHSDKTLTQRTKADVSVDDALFVQSIGKMMEPFESLESLSAVLPPNIKNYYLSQILRISLLTNDPAAFINEQVKQNRSYFFLRKLATYLSNTGPLSVSKAENFIRVAIISCYHSKKAMGTNQTIKASLDSKDMNSELSHAVAASLFDKAKAKGIVRQILATDPENKIGKTIMNYIDSNH